MSATPPPVPHSLWSHGDIGFHSVRNTLQPSDLQQPHPPATPAGFHVVQDSVPASSRQYSHRLRCVTLASSPPTSQRLISLRTPALGVLFFKHGQFGLTCGKKAHYSGDLSEHAIFWLPTQDSGNQPFSIKGLMICAPLNQCSYKKLCGNCVLSLQHHHASHLLTLKTAIRKQKRSNHSVRALAVARRSRRLRFHLSALCSSFRGARAPPPGHLQNH